MIPEHVAKLREGVTGWDEWRRENPGVKPALGGAKLTCAKLAGAELAGADMHDACLHRADLTCADLTAASLRNADLTCAVLTGANLTGANLSRAHLSRANLTGANLRRANLRDAVEFDPRRWVPLYERKYLSGVQHAFKLVRGNGHGVYRGGIDYLAALESGDALEVKAANTDEHTDCGAGINVATLAWCLCKQTLDNRILIVAFEASDIAAIPWTGDGKFRLHRCRVVGEYEGATDGAK